ncbi:hypothetical protein [Streptomyces sp. G-G2]|uniref:hypothetical protein n=1 Tax=Streptomyces sp. G-G2 TaxID=3046201 RepID=UPI0024B967D1|nr:hypothetical protein [Streptomyces sp. G-G2]MDJ0382963.1 hypothetical protein [Streptomyces sp. G-G2]
MTGMPGAAGWARRIREGGNGASWEQRALALGAAFFGAFVAFLGCLEFDVGIVCLVPATPLVLPVLVFRRRAEFRLAALIVGALYLFFGVFGFMLGLVFFLPCGVLLLLAAVADGYRRPVTAALLTVIGFLVLAVTLWWLGSAAWSHSTATGAGGGSAVSGAP